MQVQVNIEFDQLVKLVKSLPSVKLRQLRAEIDKKTSISGSNSELEHLLLGGPTATAKQLQVISQNRKTINEWRMEQ